MFQLGKTRALQEQVKSLQDKLGPLRVDNERMMKELGVGRAADVIALVRNLEGRVAELTAVSGGADVSEDSLEGLNDPMAVLAKIRQFNGKIENMNETVASMEAQLVSLYADKEVLEKEIGASEVEDVIEAFQSLQMTISAMESQLMTLYAGREHFEVELGESDPHRLVKTFKSVAQLVRSIDDEMGATVFTRLGEDISVKQLAMASSASMSHGYAEEGTYDR